MPAFLHPWIEANEPAYINRSAFPHNDHSMPEPHGCPDTALAALTQLAALRMHARRAFVTLLSTTVEYVLAEATRTMSLQYDIFEDPKDAPWLGTCSFMRTEGVNDLAIQSWRKARRLREVPEDEGFWYTDGLTAHAMILCDVRTQTKCLEKPFVRRAPWLRFFCSVPLRDLQGSVIGSLTICDDQPRHGISMHQMAFLEDMSDTITEHLDATIVKAQRQRSERLIQGLSLFNKGKDSLRHWWLAQDDDRLRRAGGRWQNQAVDHEAQNVRLAKEFGTQDLSNMPPTSRRSARKGTMGPKNTALTAARSNSAAANDRRVAHVAIQDFGKGRQSADTTQPEFVGEGSSGEESVGNARSRSKASSIRSSRNSSKTKKDSQADPFDLGNASEQAYARASNLIREAVSAEGVVFVDASVASTDAKRFNRRDGTYSSHASANEAIRSSTSDTEQSDNGGREQTMCNINGFSTTQKSTLHGSRSQHFSLSDSNLATLIGRYPHGKIFNFEDNGELYSSSGDEYTSAGTGESESGLERKPAKRQSHDAKQLGRVMVGARSIAFYPIWDDATERWRTCLFVWTTAPLRFFDPTEDITYLSAFSHSLVAELGRLETMASDLAKGTFISSISHELRSPLHGVLAGAEFLLESNLSPFQGQMVSTISMAGRTLLDTVNHILDFSKISSFSKVQRKERAVADASRHLNSIAGDQNELGVTSSVDLARLTEEVVETVVSARRFESHVPRAARRTSTASAEMDSPDPTRSEAVCVTLNIDQRDNWMIDISPGSWTRILTNVVGNAFKYTQKGTVAVTLTVGETLNDRRGQRRVVTLTVQDTGIGMSSQFLTNGLYTPFKQADSHSAGTGLGLSIVKQIAKDIHGDLDVFSDLGKGTRVQLSFKAKFVDSAGQDDAALRDLKLFRAVSDLDLLRFHLYTLGDEAQHSESNATIAVGNSVRDAATQWLRCESSAGPQLPANSETSLCAISESDLLWLADKQPEQLSSMLSDIADRRVLPLILARSVGSMGTDLLFDDFPIEPIFVHQVIGPRKLLRSIITAQDSKTPGPASTKTLQNISSVPATPLVFQEYNPHGQQMQIEGDYFSRNGGTVAAAKSEGGLDLEEQTPMPDNSPRRAQSRPRISRRTTAISSHSRALASPHPVDWSPTSGGITSPESSGEAVVDGSTVLLVEDNEINMKLLMALMRRSKLRYETATNGLEALQVYSSHPSRFFLIFMDMGMPIMDGFISTSKIREVERKKRLLRCTIVALTGVTSADSRETALRAGVDKYFTKPIRMKELSTLVAEIKH
ncbi:hypothetical protein LTR08_000412 [Meristemomyces frigidus]|nr:hypothetical protein LTR08_000412 [Meristemomyces frigidus]